MPTRMAFDRAAMAIDFLTRHRLDPGPVNYALAMAYLSGDDAALTADVDRLIDGDIRLTPEDAAMLAERHLGLRLPTAADSGREVRAQAEKLHGMTSEAADLTAAVGRDLTRMRDAEGGVQRDGMTPGLLDRIMANEREMARLRDEVATLRQEIEQRAAFGGNFGYGEGDGDDRDPLTALPGAVAGGVLLQRIAESPAGYALALCVLDDLEPINARYGRQVGDNVLRALSATLRQTCEDNPVIRWSGTEFLVAMEGFSAGSARSLIEEARNAMAARTLRLRGTGEPIGTVTFSAGIAVARGVAPDEPLERARDGVRQAMAQGGDRVVG